MRQCQFPISLKILEDGDGVAQIGEDFFAYLCEMRKLVRSCILDTLYLSGFSAAVESLLLGNKLITRTMHCAEMHWIGRILFQFLS